MTKLHRLINKPFAIASAVVVALSVQSCHRVPGYVIQPDEMASLMADIHIGEAVVEYNRSQYPSDSSRMALKQSIYARHGVTSQQVDTSFDWYGHNIQRYMEVYERTISILDARLAETGNRISAEAAMSVAGDSVDVWTNPRFVTISSRMPSNMITFNFHRDQNWEAGDSYTWRMKMINNTNGSNLTIVADYADGSTELVSMPATREGWNEVTFITDSLKQVQRIYGVAEITTDGGKNVWLDSIALVRNRLNQQRYNQRYHQRMVKALTKED